MIFNLFLFTIHLWQKFNVLQKCSHIAILLHSSTSDITTEQLNTLQTNNVKTINCYSHRLGTVYEEHEELYIPIPDDIAEDEPKLVLHAVFINRLDKYPIVNLCS